MILEIIFFVKNIKNKREKITLSSEMQVRPLVESDEELEQQLSEDENTASNR